MMGSIRIGPYVTGEIPPPLEYQFLQADGTPIDLSVGAPWVARFDMKERYGPLLSLTASVTDAANGKVTRVWDGSEFETPGDYRGEFWVDNDTNRYASRRIVWCTVAAVAESA